MSALTSFTDSVAIANVKSWVIAKLIEPSGDLPRPEDRRSARLVTSLLLAMIGFGPVATILPMIQLMIATDFVTALSRWWSGLVAYLLAVGVYGISRTKHFRLAIHIVLAAISASIFVSTILGYVGDNILASLMYLTLIPLVASIVLSTRAVVIWTLCNLVALVVTGLLLDPGTSLFGSRYFYSAQLLGLVSACIALGMRHRSLIELDRQSELIRVNKELEKSVAEARAATTSAEEANEQKDEVLATLEERVLERTRDLQVAADIARQITTVLDLDDLLPELVARTKEAFSLYHVSVFFYDPNTEQVVLSAGTGEAGQHMKTNAKSFHLSERPSLVAQAVSERKAIVTNDVLASPNYLANPLLPKTRAEMVLPMQVGGELIGVLDLQSDQVDRFKSEDIDILSTLAEQIAIAIKNAKLYAMQKQAAEDMQQADKIKTQFLASMSHELRTPLNAILTFNDLMAQGVFGNVNQEQEEFLQKSLKSGRHLLALINDILDLSKIQSGMLKLFIEDDFDICHEMDVIAETAEGLLRGKPVTLIRDLDTEFPSVSCDKRRVRQVLLNLIGNAVKFTEKGTITLSAKRRQDGILFAVMDTGPGIPAEDQSKIFVPFIQTSAGIEYGAGTGLGLPITKNLVEAHGGRIWVDSNPGEGAAFYVVLPFAAPAPPA